MGPWGRIRDIKLPSSYCKHPLVDSPVTGVDGPGGVQTV